MDAAPFHIVLYEPQIPQNTGSIARLCACTGASLHLIYPLGFDASEKAVKRAGLDYWEHVQVIHHENWDAFLHTQSPEQLFLLTKFSDAPYTERTFSPGAYFVFGSETTGLPEFLHESYPDRRLGIPIRRELVRSLNLAQAAAIVLYEAIRQNPSPLP